MGPKLSNRTVLVTGGGGFIGSFLTKELVSQGADVRVADDFSRGDRTKLSPVMDEVEILPVDLTTHRGCIEATEGVDDVFHLAASVGGIHYIERENVGGLTPSVLMNQQMLEAARVTGVKRFLFASSACVYRQQHDSLNMFTEDQAVPADPHSTYGWAKVLGEVACRAYHHDTHLKTGSVRIFNCYGPQESLDPESSHVIPSLCRKAIETPEGGTVPIFGDGSQQRGFIYVTDLVDGLLAAMEQSLDGEPVNLGNSLEVVSIEELAERIVDISGKDLTIEHDHSKPTGTDKYACEMSRMRSVLDWEPSISLNDGLERTYRWAESKLGETDPVVAADGGEGE
jgi:nucleoside-diphosphate-sugar epimerase